MAPRSKPVAPAATPAVEVGRFESFEATRPDGAMVVVRRNIDTGEQTVTVKE